MNQGIYRAGGPVAGLPLPRTHLTVATAAIAGSALAAIVHPLLSFALLALCAASTDPTVLEPYANVRAYLTRCMDRPAWKRTRDAYFARVDVFGGGCEAAPRALNGNDEVVIRAGAATKRVPATDWDARRAAAPARSRCSAYGRT